MRVGEVDGNWVEIQSDDGQMIGGMTIFDRQRVHVNMVSAFGPDLYAEHMPRIQTWAEAEARRLGMLDDASGP